MAAAEARHAAERTTNAPLEVMLTTSGQESVPQVRNQVFQAGIQNSRHGEKNHAIATGRGHRCSGWAGLYRRRSTACRLISRVVNADAGNEFIAPSSQHPSHMPLHLERPGGAETVAR
jgi:hypothetical protein